MKTNGTMRKFSPLPYVGAVTRVAAVADFVGRQ